MFGGVDECDSCAGHESRILLMVNEKKEDKGKSIRWVVIMSMIFVAYVAWGCPASSWAGSEGDGSFVVIGRGRSRGILMLVSAIVSFLVTSVAELPNLVTVISWNFTNRLWLPILFIVLEACILAGGFGLQQLENNLAKPAGRRKKKRRRKKPDHYL